MPITRDEKVRTRLDGALEGSIVRLIVAATILCRRLRNPCRTAALFQRRFDVLRLLSELHPEPTGGLGQDRGRRIEFNPALSREREGAVALAAGNNERRDKDVGVKDHSPQGLRTPVSPRLFL